MPKLYPRYSVFNDTDVETFDPKKASWNELGDTFTANNTRMEEIEGKYDGVTNYTEEDTKAYKSFLTQNQKISEEKESRPEQLKEQRAVLNVVPNASSLNATLTSLNSRITVTSNAIDEDPRFGFKSDQEFMREVCNFYTKKKMDPRLEAVITNAIGADEYKRGSWESAGILIPEGFLTTVIRMTPEEDMLLGKMTSVPMSVPSLKIPAAVDKNHATSFTGGTRVYRTSETLTVDKTKDTFENVSMEATELIGEAAATKVLMRYSPISIPALIAQSMQYAYQYKRQDEIITGDGQGKYLGFLNAVNGSLISVSRTAGQADATILSGTDILKMRKQVWGYDMACWVFNHDLFEWVAQLHIESPNAAGLIKLYSPQTGDVPELLNGRPIVWTEFMPGIQSGQDGSVCTEWGETATGLHYAACVNMSQYLHGQLYTEEARSTHVRFSEREEVFQFVQCDDARPHWLTYLTPKRGITTRSPFVALINTSTAS